MKCVAAVLGMSLFVSLPVTTRAISITFNYTYDAGGFFSGGNAPRRDILDLAASVYETRLYDSLTAITPGGINSWTADFSNPATGAGVSVANLSVAADTLVIYVGARNLGGSTLGYGGYGGYSVSGNAGFLNTVQTRGQSGAPNTEFGPWGGDIAFNSASSWYFDSDPSTTESFTGQEDFYSVAVHEIGHILGLGTATSWMNLTSGSDFTGTKAKLANGGANVPLELDLGHFADGTMSTIPGTGTAQEAALDPTLTTGTRKYATTLDFAALDDIGWDVSAATPVPEPGVVALLGLGVAGWLVGRGRRAGR